jgi:hypothetical protein
VLGASVVDVSVDGTVVVVVATAVAVMGATVVVVGATVVVVVGTTVVVGAIVAVMGAAVVVGAAAASAVVAAVVVVVGAAVVVVVGAAVVVVVVGAVVVVAAGATAVVVVAAAASATVPTVVVVVELMVVVSASSAGPAVALNKAAAEPAPVADGAKPWPVATAKTKFLLGTVYTTPVPEPAAASPQARAAPTYASSVAGPLIDGNGSLEKPSSSKDHVGSVPSLSSWTARSTSRTGPLQVTSTWDGPAALTTPYQSCSVRRSAASR